MEVGNVWGSQSASVTRRRSLAKAPSFGLVEVAFRIASVTIVLGQWRWRSWAGRRSSALSGPSSIKWVGDRPRSFSRATVLVGLLQRDTSSYLVQKPKWTPTLGSAGRSFGMKDFLTFAGVDPASRGQ